MRILKRIVLVLLILIALPFIIAIFLPRESNVTVSGVINRPSGVVYDYIRILDNHKHFSAWILQDPNLVPEVRGIDGTVGAILSWNSEKMGKGEQEIVGLSPQKLELELRFIEPMSGKADVSYEFESIGENQTQLVSKFHSVTNYPWNFMSVFFGNSMVRKMETESIQNLKTILE